MTLDELGVAFGAGKNLRYISVYAIVSRLGVNKARAFPAFHAFTCCEQSSAFLGIGKKSAWTTSMSCDEVTESFETKHTAPSSETLLNAL
ncbi:hypothetical protein DPMN_154550 [Dreissena polymorpha]|uniref:Uncharacterized protein n=1 Tax=Dreissena polymorpha TaxID=45954 RepID=A0A9D4FM81_DREPO|nr:hypothetical protein DPMN_154550 [Dreissena polymorpha]